MQTVPVHSVQMGQTAPQAGHFRTALKRPNDDVGGGLAEDALRKGEVMTSTPASPVTLSKLVSRQEVAERTIAFRFEKPTNWTFKAGQCLDMTLLDPSETDAEGNTRTFSIASAPHEETLMVATRMRDTAFKRVLKTMPLGSAVKI